MIVQRKVFAPTPKPVMPEVGEDGVVMVPVPVINVHTPVPIIGEFPANVATVEQTVWSEPALAAVGTASLFIITSSVDIAQTPFVIVQRKVFAPTPKPVIPEVGDDGVVIVPVPVINVHAPVPIIGEFPAKVAVVEQTVWSGPALDVVGTASLLIITSSVDIAHTPFVIVQRNVFAPTPKPVMPEVGDVGVVIVPVPVINVQAPVPIAGIFPARVAVVEQTV